MLSSTMNHSLLTLPYQGHIRVISEPYQGHIRVISEPYQGQTRATSEPDKDQIRARSEPGQVQVKTRMICPSQSVCAHPYSHVPIPDQCVCGIVPAKGTAKCPVILKTSVHSPVTSAYLTSGQPVQYSASDLTIGNRNELVLSSVLFCSVLFCSEATVTHWTVISFSLWLLVPAKRHHDRE